jgi:hypothetical protein
MISTHNDPARLAPGEVKSKQLAGLISHDKLHVAYTPEERRALSVLESTGGSRTGDGRQADPTAGMQLSLAQLTCQSGRFKLYLAGGSNVAEEEWCDAEAAVSSGRPYFGLTHPWIWAIDVDVVDPAGYRHLCGVLDDAGLEERFDCRSGGLDRLHLFVYEPEGPNAAIRQRVVDEVNRVYPGLFDFRMQGSGSPIRPPGAPHRSGIARSEPVDGFEEAHDVLQAWFQRHGWEVLSQVPRPVRGRIADLSARDQALLRSEWAEADRIGPPVPRKNGKVDRSAVDIALALAFMGAGLGQQDFVSARSSGPFASPKAVEHPDPAAYLMRQWNWTRSNPYKTRVTSGLSELGAFEAQFVLNNVAGINLGARTLLSAFVDQARQLNRTSFDWSRRDMREETELGLATIDRAIDALVAAGLVKRYPAQQDDHADGYQLLIGAAIRRLEGLKTDHIPSLSLSQCDPISYFPSICHPAFGRSALKRTAFSVLLCFSPTVPRTQAEAMRHGGPSPSTFKARVAALRAAGVLRSVDGGRV